MKKQILTGAEFFEEIIEGDYFYIDKTLFIKELLENKGKVTLITRPRRFGKTLNMNMLEQFFDVGKNSERLFEGLAIAGHKDIVEKHQNKYPVVSITLKNVEERTYGETIENIGNLVSEMYEKKLYLYEGDTLNERQKERFHRFWMNKATDMELKSSLSFLTDCLQAHHKKRAIVLVDEYDTPIANASAKGFYADMIEFMRGFLGGVFKTNDSLEFGVLTGVQRVSKESLVSSFNNPMVCGVMSELFAECFGFTEDEVRAACETYGVGDMFNEVKRWYDGYRFGGRDMYNPWSITGYLKEKEFEEYWANTGSMAIFQDVYRRGDATLRDDMAGLITGAPITMSVEDGITYPIEYESSDAFWTLLLSAGYIKPCNGARTGSFKAELVNMEIRNLFSRQAKKWFGSQHRAINEAIQKFVGCLLCGDAQGVSDALNKDLLNDPSCYDFKEENSYHMFIYGILLAVSDDCVVQSNPETGKGRSDCVIKPLDKAKPAVVLEFKHSGRDGEDLEAEAKRGLTQIDEKGYIHELRREGYELVYKYGIAFHKKSCAVAMEAQSSTQK